MYKEAIKQEKHQKVVVENVIEVEEIPKMNLTFEDEALMRYMSLCINNNEFSITE